MSRTSEPIESLPIIREAMGQSEAFLSFQERLRAVASVDRPVLIIGERGTGKELAASRLHYQSPRWSRSLVALNCAALPATLIESELFGYEAGAFTGAARRRAGRFEAADGGTLFLDEIGSIPLEVQAKILRVVEYQTFERLGSSVPIQVDVRIVAATNADLLSLAEEGRFQRDLLDRLCFEVLYLPPLRERQGDVPLLANYFAFKMAHELGRPEVPAFSDSVLAALEAYTWPGNIRELKNVVERAVYRSETALIEEVVFDPFPKFSPVPPPGQKKTPLPMPPDHPQPQLSGQRTLVEKVADFEISLLKQALQKARFNQKKAAEALGLSYHQFRGLYRKYGGRRLGEE